MTEAADFEAQQLLSAVCGCDRAVILLNEREISPEEETALAEAAKRRTDGEPLQYILGEWDFYGRTFSVGKGVLIPRADTETLIEAVMDALPGRHELEIADLCSGSGCIAVTLAEELSSRVTAVEKSEDALFYLRKNTACCDNRIQVVKDDVLYPKESYPKFDLIVSNPPYLSGADMQTLQREVTHEPEMALYGGVDGLLFYRQLPLVWRSRLKKGGWLFFEIGMGQEAAVLQILRDCGFTQLTSRADLGGIVRVVGGCWTEEQPKE